MKMDQNGVNFNDILKTLYSGGIFSQPSPRPGEADNRHSESGFSFRLSPEPFLISQEEYSLLEGLGDRLLAFYRAANKLYFLSSKGLAPKWVSEYLDAGKPDTLLKFCRMNRTKNQLPAIIRPDMVVHDDGYVICELDSVPGGFGTVTCLNSIYSDFNCIGGTESLPRGFYGIFRSLTQKDTPNVAIVVSGESSDYRPEMEFMASFSRERNIGRLHVVSPGDIIFREDGLFIPGRGGKEIRLDAIYRFFELFDLDNIPKSELIIYSLKKNRVRVSPPYKHFLEEKLLLALFRHPILESFWEKELGSEGYGLLRNLFPESWIVDSRPVPPHAVIPGFKIGGRRVAGWEELKTMTKRERRMILKISGFSPLAWGSRGVFAGHDMSERDWSDAVDRALEGFPENPFIIQKFFKAKKVRLKVFDESGRVNIEEGRARLSPYYIVEGDRAVLKAVLATVCPLDKVLIHGMTRSVMLPCARGRIKQKSYESE